MEASASHPITDEQTTDETGRWVTPPVSYVEPHRIFCAFCGRPLARRYWQGGPEAAPLAFCDPAHAARYRTYTIPLYGAPQAD